MRKIKFRVWDKEKLLMHKVSELVWMMGPKLDGDVIKFYGPGFGSGWVDGDNYILMQYTGFKDRNGTEVCEGDVVLVGRDGQVAEVVFEDGCFYTPVGISRYRLYGWEKDAIKVIGNIYENPELMEVRE